MNARSSAFMNVATAPNDYSPKGPQPQMATAPNGAQPQMATAPNGHSPKWPQPQTLRSAHFLFRSNPYPPPLRGGDRFFLPCRFRPRPDGLADYWSLWAHLLDLGRRFFSFGTNDYIFMKPISKQQTTCSIYIYIYIYIYR